MIALEQEVLEKLLLLDEAAQQRLMQMAEQSCQERTAQWQAWLADFAHFKHELSQAYPAGWDIDVVELLHEIREGE